MVIWDGSDVKVYSEYDEIKITQIYTRIEDIIGELKEKHVVDYGCGDGIFLEKLISESINLYGFDTSKSMIDASKKRLKTYPNIKLNVIESGKIPLGDNSVDVVASNLVLMMCPKKENLEDIFADIYRVLKPEGMFIYLITHPAFIEKDFNIYRNIFTEEFNYLKEESSYKFVLKGKNGSEKTTDSFVDYHYTLSTYLNLLTETKFKNIRIEEIDVKGNMYPPYMIVYSKK